MRVRSECFVPLAAALLMLGASAGADEKEGEVVGVAAPTTAQGGLFQNLSLGSRRDPIRINSDSLELDYRGSTLTYSGKVQVTQGDVTLSSDRLAITYDRSPAQPAQPAQFGAQGVPDAAAASDPAANIKEVVAEGKVRIRQGERVAEGSRAVFDRAAQTIVLSEGAVLHEGPNQVTGDRIIVYLREERSVVEGGANSRVKAVLYPESASGDESREQGEASTLAAGDATPPSATPQR
jgi:lipopolysaccharide export system protein LptA